MFLLEDIKISFRNPVEFINQWGTTRERIRAIFLWLVWTWRRNDCDVWIIYGIRVLGIEISYTRYIK